jgi:uncharacterized Zn finger protein
MRRDFIPVEKIEAMASAAARCLDPELFEKGRQHYRKGRVEYARVFGPRIYAQVSDIIDGKKYIVQLHIASFPALNTSSIWKRDKSPTTSRSA